jgi:eukaryotic-like serine/threonine-protein kinase
VSGKINDPTSLHGSPDLNEQRVGLVLNGKWRLDTLLGVGGMAAVYAASHRNGNRVAVKILHPHCAIIENIRSRFQREGYVANKVEHPGAVRVLDDDTTEDGTPFLIMDLLEGETLEACFNRHGRLTFGDALAIGYRLLEVLAAAHAKGIVHRDIKLDNVFLTRSGEVKILDFGIARLAESSELHASRTRTGAMMGTPAFMAPEQALGRSNDIDAQTDIWAVGATLFKMLTGRYVHEANTMNEQLVQAATKPAPPLMSVLPHAPPELARVVDRSLAFHKSERFSSAQEMQEAIFPLLSASDMAAHPLGTPTGSSTPIGSFTPISSSGPMPSPSVPQSGIRSPTFPSPMSIRSPTPRGSSVGPARPTATNVVAEVSGSPAHPHGRSSRLLLLAAALGVLFAVGIALWVSVRKTPAAPPEPRVAAEPLATDSLRSAPPVHAEAPSPVPSAAVSVAKPASSSDPRLPLNKPSEDKLRKRPANKQIPDDDDPFGRRH